MVLKTTTGFEDPAKFIAASILKQLQLQKKVLWFATGGSSVSIGVEVSKILRVHPHQNLTVTLTDERYGDLNHPDSNWNQLIKKGFDLPEAKLLPILCGEDASVTNTRFNTILEEELGRADYKIGLFGVGTDGHTAGILPNSEAVSSTLWSVGYKSDKFERITISPKTIMKLDEAVVFMQGKEKWSITEEFLNQTIDLSLQPAQILKEVPLLTIFSDYPGSRA